MARPKKKTARKKQAKRGSISPIAGLLWLRRWFWRLAAVVFLIVILLVALGAAFNPPTNIYMFSESRRLGSLQHSWVRMAQIAPVMARSAVAAEDANFCQHWGFDVDAIRAAIDEGGGRGASTITQQTVKNVYLWHGRLWLRKAMEALVTPVVEAIWTKRRILEVYLNVAEFDEGVFGVEAAAQHYFDVPASALSATQAARLAAILPAPKARSASNPSSFVRKRTRQIMSGAATIRADGRANCFES